MKRFTIYGSLLLFACVLGGYFGMGQTAVWQLIVQSVHAQSTSLSEYSIWTHMIGVDGAGARGEADLFHGRRSNGDTVETNTSPGMRRTVHSPSHGILVEIDDARKITTTWGTGEAAFPLKQVDCRPGDGQSLTPGDSKEILGFKAIRTVMTSPFHRAEIWRAPALGCAILEHSTYFWKDSMEPNPGAYDGYTLITATKALAVAPDASVFAVPEGAQEMSSLAYLTVIGRPAKRPFDEQERYRMEKVYAEERSKRQAAGVTLSVFK